jgi:putative oxidoreductase
LRIDQVLSGPTESRAASIAFATRLIAGGIFIAFGAGKFLNHGSELASFQSYGLPSPDLLVSAIGALELVGGVALILGLGTRLAAVVLAVTWSARSSSRGSHAERSSA